ncbi:hypothetical protein 10P302A_gene0013 [Pseudomonas phage 10P302A]|uniref:Uncharacterized protein n=1 Tax=Pseudomonas phage 10P302A TaxID=3038233 RepID=A0AAF0GJ53_9CAUD|nr:hypothetical protein 10P302A_gene0013 [Pseudomonas phage 10P302A]
MQVIVTATSSKVDDLILIETSTTIGDQTTTSKVGYDAQELMDNRFLSGDLDTRIEALRAGAERMTIKGVELHFKTLMNVLQKPAEITDVSAVPSSQLQGVEADVLVVDEVAQEAPVKKTRAKRTTKTTNTESN